MPTTIRDVARHADVSIATVSRVLNHNDNVSSDTRERVLSAISALNFSPNFTARRLSLGKSLAIGAIVPFSTRPAFVERLQGVITTIDDTPYDFVIYNIEKNVQRERCFSSQQGWRDRLDGMIIISIIPTDQEMKFIFQSGIPVVLVDAYHPQLNSVCIDDEQGGWQATNYLLSLGHRRIGFVSDYIPEDSADFGYFLGNNAMKDRLKGYQRALANAGILFDPAYHAQNVHGRAPACYSAHQLLSLPNPPTAIFATSDTQAMGVLQAARERGLDVPGDLSVIGFDDIELAEYLHLTTVRQSLYQSGVLVAQMLLGLLESSAKPIQHRLLTTELVLRGTTAPCQSKISADTLF